MLRHLSANTPWSCQDLFEKGARTGRVSQAGIQAVVSAARLSPAALRRVIASNHHPLYSTDTSFKEYDQMRQQLEPLMYQYGVDLFFNGHVHSYERCTNLLI